MAELTIRTVDLVGTNPTLVNATAGGDVFANNGRTLFKIKNSGASSITVTFKAQSFSNFGTKTDNVVTVTAGDEVLVGFFKPERFNNSNGRVEVSYSAVTSVQVAPISIVAR